MTDPMQDILNKGLSFKLRDGHFVNSRVQQVCQAIHEYEPELNVLFVPEAQRREGEAAYKIVHTPVGGQTYILFTVRRDEDFDHRVLQRIIANDQRHGKTPLTEYEAWEQSQRLIETQKAREQMEEANDIAYHVLRTHKNVYKVNDKVTIRDFGGII